MSQQNALHQHDTTSELHCHAYACSCTCIVYILQVVTASQEKNPDLLNAVAISMGMMGIITEVTLQCEDKFNLEETLTAMPLQNCLDNLIEFANSAQHVKLWIETTSGSCGVFFTNRTDEQPRDNQPLVTVANLKVQCAKNTDSLIHAFDWLTVYKTPSQFFSCSLQISVYEFISWAASWMESIARPSFYLLFTMTDLFVPHNRVDVSYRVFNVPHYLPEHHEAEVVVGIEDCANAIQELKEVVVDYDIPLNFASEVSSIIIILKSIHCQCVYLAEQGNV